MLISLSHDDEYGRYFRDTFSKHVTVGRIVFHNVIIVHSRLDPKGRHRQKG